jgi:hypothetical protein
MDLKNMLDPWPCLYHSLFTTPGRYVHIFYNLKLPYVNLRAYIYLRGPLL